MSLLEEDEKLEDFENSFSPTISGIGGNDGGTLTRSVARDQSDSFMHGDEKSAPSRGFSLDGTFLAESEEYSSLSLGNLDDLIFGVKKSTTENLTTGPFSDSGVDALNQPTSGNLSFTERIDLGEKTTSKIADIWEMLESNAGSKKESNKSGDADSLDVDFLNYTKPGGNADQHGESGSTPWEDDFSKTVIDEADSLFAKDFDSVLVGSDRDANNSAVTRDVNSDVRTMDELFSPLETVKPIDDTDSQSWNVFDNGGTAMIASDPSSGIDDNAPLKPSEVFPSDQLTDLDVFSASESLSPKKTLKLESSEAFDFLHEGQDTWTSPEPGRDTWASPEPGRDTWTLPEPVRIDEADSIFTKDFDSVLVESDRDADLERFQKTSDSEQNKSELLTETWKISEASPLESSSEIVETSFLDGLSLEIISEVGTGETDSDNVPNRTDILVDSNLAMSHRSPNEDDGFVVESSNDFTVSLDFPNSRDGPVNVDDEVKPTSQFKESLTNDVEALEENLSPVSGSKEASPFGLERLDDSTEVQTVKSETRSSSTAEGLGLSWPGISDVEHAGVSPEVVGNKGVKVENHPWDLSFSVDDESDDESEKKNKSLDLDIVNDVKPFDANKSLELKSPIESHFDPHFGDDTKPFDARESLDLKSPIESHFDSHFGDDAKPFDAKESLDLKSPIESHFDSHFVDDAKPFYARESLDLKSPIESHFDSNFGDDVKPFDATESLDLKSPIESHFDSHFGDDVKTFGAKESFDVKSPVETHTETSEAFRDPSNEENQVDERAELPDPMQVSLPAHGVQSDPVSLFSDDLFGVSSAFDKNNSQTIFSNDKLLEEYRDETPAVLSDSFEIKQSSGNVTEPENDIYSEINDLITESGNNNAIKSPLQFEPTEPLEGAGLELIQTEPASESKNNFNDSLWAKNFDDEVNEASQLGGNLGTHADMNKLASAPEIDFENVAAAFRGNSPTNFNTVDFSESVGKNVQLSEILPLTTDSDFLINAAENRREIFSIDDSEETSVPYRAADELHDSVKGVPDNSLYLFEDDFVKASDESSSGDRVSSTATHSAVTRDFNSQARTNDEFFSPLETVKPTEDNDSQPWNVFDNGDMHGTVLMANDPSSGFDDDAPLKPSEAFPSDQLTDLDDFSAGESLSPRKTLKLENSEAFDLLHEGQDTWASDEPVRDTWASPEPERDTWASPEPERDTWTSDEPVRDILTSSEPGRDAWTSDEPVRDTWTSEEPVRDILTSSEPERDRWTSDEPMRDTWASDEPVRDDRFDGSAVQHLNDPGFHDHEIAVEFGSETDSGLKPDVEIFSLGDIHSEAFPDLRLVELDVQAGEIEHVKTQSPYEHDSSPWKMLGDDGVLGTVMEVSEPSTPGVPLKHSEMFPPDEFADSDVLSANESFSPSKSEQGIVQSSPFFDDYDENIKSDKKSSDGQHVLEMVVDDFDDLGIKAPGEQISSAEKSEDIIHREKMDFGQDMWFGRDIHHDDTEVLSSSTTGFEEGAVLACEYKQADDFLNKSPHNASFDEDRIGDSWTLDKNLPNVLSPDDMLSANNVLSADDWTLNKKSPNTANDVLSANDPFSDFGSLSPEKKSVHGIWGNTEEQLEEFHVVDNSVKTDNSEFAFNSDFGETVMNAPEIENENAGRFSLLSNFDDTTASELTWGVPTSDVNVDSAKTSEIKPEESLFAHDIGGTTGFDDNVESLVSNDMEFDSKEVELQKESTHLDAAHMIGHPFKSMDDDSAVKFPFGDDMSRFDTLEIVMTKSEDDSGKMEDEEILSVVAVSSGFGRSADMTGSTPDDTFAGCIESESMLKSSRDVSVKTREFDFEDDFVHEPIDIASENKISEVSDAAFLDSLNSISLLSATAAEDNVLLTDNNALLADDNTSPADNNTLADDSTLFDDSPSSVNRKQRLLSDDNVSPFAESFRDSHPTSLYSHGGDDDDDNDGDFNNPFAKNTFSDSFCSEIDLKYVLQDNKTATNSAGNDEESAGYNVISSSFDETLEDVKQLNDFEENLSENRIPETAKHLSDVHEFRDNTNLEKYLDDDDRDEKISKDESQFADDLFHHERDDEYIMENNVAMENLTENSITPNIGLHDSSEGKLMDKSFVSFISEDLDKNSMFSGVQGSAEDILEQRESAEAEPLNLEPSQTGSGRALDEELAAAENVEIDARQNEENISNAPENQMPSESVGLDKPPESEVPADEFCPMTPESVDVAIDKSKTDDYDDKTEQISRQSESITSAALSESSHSGALASDRLESADSDRSCLLPEPADLHSKPSEPPPSVVPDTSTVELKQSATTVESDDFLFHDSHPQRTASNSESATLDAKLDDSSSDFANLKLELLDAKSQSEEPKHESEDRAESVPSPESTVRSKEAASQKEQVLSGKTLDDSQLPSQTSAKVSSESVGTTAKVLKRSNTEVIPAVEKAELQKTGSSENLSCSSSHTSSEAPTRPSLLLPKETLQQFQHYTRDDLILLVLDQQRLLKERDAHIHDLENYIDNLLVKIINTQPRILSTNDSQPAKHSAVSPSNSGKLRSP